ncbi:helix-hairpin-helix domain-containing protein [Burkholderia glumae]|uniref:helix-hairpin-helix domain-containing protein n=1 Tax=Burkholderia glumae TaxID=337 RepID=UPI001F21985C|nr:helix-hairpin-helix domain-containing protein [Burkholderia glumae]
MGLSHLLHPHHFTETELHTMASLYGTAAASKVSEDPYRLLAVSDFEKVDAVARAKFAISGEDPRRLNGAVDAAFHALHDIGTMIVAREVLISSIRSIARIDEITAERACSLAERSGRATTLTGEWLMSEACARAECILVRNLITRLVLSNGNSPNYDRVTSRSTESKVQTAVNIASSKRLSLFIDRGDRRATVSLIQKLTERCSALGEEVVVLVKTTTQAARLSRSVGFRPRTFSEFIEHCMGPAKKSKRLLLILSSSLDVFLAAKIAQRLLPTDAVAFIGESLPECFNRLLVLPTLMSMREIASAVIHEATDLYPNVLTKEIVDQIRAGGSPYANYDPRNASLQGLFRVSVDSANFSRAVIGLTYQLSQHGGVTIVTRHSSESRHFCELVERDKISGPLGAARIRVAAIDDLEPGDTESSVIALLDPSKVTTEWLLAAISTAIHRVVLVVGSAQADNRCRTVDSSPRLYEEHGDRWRRMAENFHNLER